jgi:hypothetical protein
VTVTSTGVPTGTRDAETVSVAPEAIRSRCGIGSSHEMVTSPSSESTTPMPPGGLLGTSQRRRRREGREPFPTFAKSWTSPAGHRIGSFGRGRGKQAITVWARAMGPST